MRRAQKLERAKKIPAPTIFPGLPSTTSWLGYRVNGEQTSARNEIFRLPNPRSVRQRLCGNLPPLLRKRVNENYFPDDRTVTKCVLNITPNPSFHSRYGCGVWENPYNLPPFLQEFPWLSGFSDITLSANLDGSILYSKHP